MLNVFWVNKNPLSDEATNALKEKLGNIELTQLSELFGEFLPTFAFLHADILAFQRGTLPPDLQDEIVKRKHIIHVVDFNFNFVEWEMTESEKTMINSICDSCGKDYTEESWLNTSVLKTGLVNYKFCTGCTKKIKSSAQAGKHKQIATTKDGNDIIRHTKI